MSSDIEAGQGPTKDDRGTDDVLHPTTRHEGVSMFDVNCKETYQPSDAGKT